MGTLKRNLLSAVAAVATLFGRSSPKQYADKHQTSIEAAPFGPVGFDGYRQHGSQGAYKRGRTVSPKSMHSGSPYWQNKMRSKHMPHQGEKECARRRFQNGTCYPGEGLV